MQAAVVHEYGGPEQLRIEPVPDPVPAPGEVVVELRYCALNYHDILVRQFGLGFPLPRIMGIDGAGTRRDTGEEVVILPSLDWGKDPAVPGPGWHILGDKTDGTYAELVKVPAENLFPKPQSLTWAEAAGLPTAGLTAYRALFTRGGLRAGQRVVVLGAGSGISTFVVSLATAAGAQVYVTSSSAEKIDRSIALGATAGARYTDPAWVDHLLELTSGGADLVVDAVGRDTESSLRCVRPGGRLVVFGAPVGATAAFDLRAFYFSQRTILGTTLGHAGEFAELLAHVDAHRWRPVMDCELPLSQVEAAHRRMEARRHFGKIILDCRA